MLIGITGEMGSGKTTIAGIISKQLDGVVLPFAQPLKEMARGFGWDGVKDKKGRKILTLFGTDICRDCIDQDYWNVKWNEACRRINNTIIIADDLRFIDESRLVRNQGGIVIKITGRRSGKPQYFHDNLWHRFKPKHRSESELRKIKPDYIIDNAGYIGVTINQITEVLKDIRDKGIH